VGVSRFRVLGPVEAWTEQTRLALAGPQQVKLLAFLLLNANRAVSSDAVIDAVWGTEREGAAKRLQMAVLRLRKTLEPLAGQDGSRLRTVRGGYLLSVEPGEIDAERFADGVHDGRRALEVGDPARAREVLTEALAMWRGPPMAEVIFEDFAQADVRRLEELRLVALESRVDADLALGRDVEVIAELEGLLAQHPTRERLASQLMLALYRSGRQSDALDVYQRTRAHLANELGLEPAPPLKALQSQILEQDPALDTTEHRKVATEAATEHDGRAEIRPALRSFGRSNLPTPATSLVGRSEEISRALELLAGREVRLLTLWGPAGAGKTRLALEVAAATVASYRDGVWVVPLAPIPDRALLVAEVSRVLGVAPVSGEPPEWALVNALAGRELLLVLDNFEHLLDAASVVADLLMAAPRVDVLATSREPLRIRGEQRMEVPPLPRRDALSCSWPAPRRSVPISPSIRTAAPRSSRSASAWTGCRWRSSSQQRGLLYSDRGNWRAGWRSAWRCPRGLATFRNGSAHCARRSAGATSCSIPPSAAYWHGYRRSSAACGSMRPNRSGAPGRTTS
jgi:DNA-binding SARP family transcriptional activator